MNLLTVFLTGLLSGGLTCLAVQGGLLASVLINKQDDYTKKNLDKGKIFPIAAFLTAKVTAYTLLGLLLGLFGSIFELSVTTRAVLQIGVGIFMLGTALNMLNVHPIFRYFLIQPPQFLSRFIRKQSKNTNIFAPLILGVFTVFLPCGTTQAMMAAALATANPIKAALIMFAFTLGTSPTFLIFGYITEKFKNSFQGKFTKIISAAVIILAILNINSGIALTGSKITLENIWNDFYCTALAFCNNNKPVLGAQTATTEATVTLNNYGYNPNTVSLKANSEVTLHLVNKDGGGCIQAFTIPSMNIQKIVRTGTSTDIKFTTPGKGDLAFMCSMGMYRGVIKII